MRSLNVRSHSRAIVQRSFTPHGLEAEENGIEISRELLAVNNGYGSSNEQEELAAQLGASDRNICMAAARSGARRWMLDAAGSAAERSASRIANRARSSDPRFVVRTGFQWPAHQQRPNLPGK
jgi:hypothetical protein